MVSSSASSPYNLESKVRTWRKKVNVRESLNRETEPIAAVTRPLAKRAHGVRSVASSPLVLSVSPCRFLGRIHPTRMLYNGSPRTGGFS